MEGAAELMWYFTLELCQLVKGDFMFIKYVLYMYSMFSIF